MSATGILKHNSIPIRRLFEFLCKSWANRFLLFKVQFFAIGYVCFYDLVNDLGDAPFFPNKPWVSAKYSRAIASSRASSGFVFGPPGCLLIWVSRSAWGVVAGSGPTSAAKACSRRTPSFNFLFGNRLCCMISSKIRRSALRGVKMFLDNTLSSSSRSRAASPVKSFSPIQAISSGVHPSVPLRASARIKGGICGSTIHLVGWSVLDLFVA